MEYDGFIYSYYLKNNNTQGYGLIINDVTFMYVDSANIGMHGSGITLPFRKGDKIKHNVNFTASQEQICYYKLRDYMNR